MIDIPYKAHPTINASLMGRHQLYRRGTHIISLFSWQEANNVLVPTHKSSQPADASKSASVLPLPTVLLEVIPLFLTVGAGAG